MTNGPTASRHLDPTILTESAQPDRRVDAGTDHAPRRFFSDDELPAAGIERGDPPSARGED